MGSLIPKPAAPKPTASQVAAEDAANEDRAKQDQERAASETDRLFRLFGATRALSASGVGGLAGRV